VDRDPDPHKYEFELWTIHSWLDTKRVRPYQLDYSSNDQPGDG